MATVLGIDTSCDDTGVGVVSEGRILANVVESQTALHARFGGVVPEQASREHLSVLDGVVERALAEAETPLGALDAVAATHGPGLVGALLVGLDYGKALAWARGLPFVPVHHLEAHIAAARTEPPFLCLIASGGHTVLYVVRSWDAIEQLGASRDDAAGEAFDKVARLLGLGYPGGPALAALAERGDERAVRLPTPMERQRGFDFSFSGLKTAVAVLLERKPGVNRADVAASFERTVVDTLMNVATRAAARTGIERLVVAGGVAANARLRDRLRSSGLEVGFPPPALATDNGVMVALAGERLLPFARDRQPEMLATDASPYLPLTETVSLRTASS